MNGMRITTRVEGPTTVLQVDGELNADSIPALIQEHEGLSGSVVLDLSGLSTIDNPAGRIILRMVDSGIRLINVSKYIQLRLFMDIASSEEPRS